MPRLTSAAVALPIALFLSIAAGGCDPDAPGASGTMTLGAGVNPASFQALAIRSFPNWSGFLRPVDADPGGRVPGE